jgi:Trypsin-co-occurring domain 2
METVGLAKALAALREELAEAQDAGAGHQFRFEITEAEVEFLVEVDAGGSAEAKATFGVVTVKAGGTISHAGSHRLRLKLSVKDAATGHRNLEVGRSPARAWDEGE